MLATTGEGINSSGTVVGVSGLLSGGDEFSFVDVGGVISILSAPAETATLALAINDGGVIAGAATSDGYATFSGFIDQGGAFTEVEAPGSTQTEIQGINNHGDMVGEYYDANGNEFAFLATPVPEPATWALMLIGITGVGLAARRRPSSRRLTDRSADTEESPWPWTVQPWRERSRFQTIMSACRLERRANLDAVTEATMVWTIFF